MDFEGQRAKMVERQIAMRGISDERVLRAMALVPRERFVAEQLVEFAYDDVALSIEEGQTISQPFIVALMAESLELGEEDRVLEVGSGSGYAAAVMSRIAREVFAVERHGVLVDVSRRRLRELGYLNVHVKLANGTLGWPEQAPFDAVSVAAGGPKVARPLLEQLAIGGRLIMPVGPTRRTQELVRVVRKSEDEYEREELGAVQFVPLIGTEGWSADGVPPPEALKRVPLRAPLAEASELGTLVREACEPMDSIEGVDLGPLLERIGDSRMVLIGEASHGTSEFYRMRARVTRELIERRGFTIVAIEGDWPDVSMIDRYVRRREGPKLPEPAFSRFPTWMWRNQEVDEFVRWLHEFNGRVDAERQVGFYGLDLYSLYSSIESVIGYLERVDPRAAEEARVRYACFSPWETDPATYGRATSTGRMRGCADEAVRVLCDLLEKRCEFMRRGGDSLFDAERNAALVQNAERYYRVMYEGSRASWNLRDRHMFETLEAVLEHRGPNSKAVVWAHNSHVGDAGATEMGVRGEVNIGQLARERAGASAYLIGLGSDHGTVAAAETWGGEMRVMDVRPSHADSYERAFHETGVEAFVLPLRRPLRAEVRERLLAPRLERAIGVVYRPDTELMSHYFQVSLPGQFDECIWIDETRAVRPLAVAQVHDVPETYPFGV